MTGDELRRALVDAAKHRCAELGRSFTREMQEAVERAIDRYLEAVMAPVDDYERVS